MAKYHNLFKKHRFWVSVLSAFYLFQTSEALLVNRDIDLQDCYNQVKTANNGNAQGRINENRFFNLLKFLDEDSILSSKNSYDDLPFYAKETYQLLISICDFDIWTDTCAGDNAEGFNMPAVPREGITEEPELYLFNICYSAYDTFAHLENSEAPTDQPSVSPSQRPSTSPSISPSDRPSVSPSQHPSTLPSVSPSQRPSTTPSVSPTQRPSVSPSAAPTASPTVSDRPSIGSENPTSAPTLSFPPSAAPTRVVTEEVSFTFNFALQYADNDNEDGLESITDYYSLIQAAFGSMINDLPNARRLRRLEVDASTFYTLGNTNFYDCPTQNTNLLEDPLCLSIDFTGSVELSGPEAIDDATIEDEVDSFEDNVVTQVEGGRLQNAVTKLDFTSGAGLTAEEYILVLDGLNGNAGQARATGTDDGGSSNRSVTTTTSVVAAAMLVLLVPFVLLLFQRTRSRDSEKQKVFYEPYEYDPAEESPSEIESEADLLQSQALSRGAVASGSQTLGATRANYGLAKPSRRVLEAMEAGDDIVAEPEFDVERDSSSNAGSSGWSSSAGISSYNTGSMDDSMDAAYAAGTTLAAIGGVTSSLNKHMHDGSSRMSDSTTTGGSVSPGYNRDQLDSFIEAGDWAAVGATAALLAAASDSQSASTAPSKRSRGSYGAESLEAQRAAELDHLVDAGDWEGVVLAAARFEATETTVYSRGSRTASSADSTGSASGASRTAGSGTIESGTVDTPSDSETASHSMSRSDDPSRARQRKEIRSEVEALVRRVVPEEIDNVDEMMNQFKGREEELVETLRTMQERAIAQKARAAGQKSAKMEARKNVQRGVVPGTRPPPPETKPVAMRSPQQTEGQAMRNIPVVPLRKSSVNSGSSQSGTNSGSASSQSNNASGESDSMKETRSTLEAAINAGDWEAVGKAAAFLSDNSVATGGTGPGAHRGQSNHSIASGSTRSRGTKDSEMATRQQELDEMISKGDWSAVVAAANRFSQMDKTVKTDVGRTAEEEDALQQAKMWANIANQTRTEGANDTGASHAAEWAIQRSLHKMNQEKSNSPASNREFDEV